MIEENSVWILTSSHNDYSQHGEYFVAAFKGRPTYDQLLSTLLKSEYERYIKYNFGDYYGEYIGHILTVGDRRETEEIWFNLRPWVFQ